MDFQSPVQPVQPVLPAVLLKLLQAQTFRSAPAVELEPSQSVHPVVAVEPVQRFPNFY
jgi:hypothetical protein